MFRMGGRQLDARPAKVDAGRDIVDPRDRLDGKVGSGDTELQNSDYVRGISRC